jgi:hypothetical protein
MGRKLRMLGVLGFGESDSLEEVAMVTWTKALRQTEGLRAHSPGGTAPHTADFPRL